MTLHYKIFKHPKPHFFSWHTQAHKIMSYKVWLRLVKPAFRPMLQINRITRVTWNSFYSSIEDNE